MMPMFPTIGIGITTFHSPMRLRKILQVLQHQGLLESLPVQGVPVRVFQDPWEKYPQDDRVYLRVCADFGVPLMRLPKWSCMQGSAQFAVENTPEEWFLYMPDDVLPTPGSVTGMLDWICQLDRSAVDGIQWPYWNADELPFKPWAHKDEMWTLPPDWLGMIPRNPHWEITGKPYPYVNLNGAGFALRRSTWKKVGGFSQETWCLDEDMGAKIWLKTEEGMVVAVPGPPLVHYMGGALDHPDHHFHCIDCWHRAGWPDKDVLHRQTRAVMKERCGTVKDDDPFPMLDRYLLGRAA